MMKNRSLAIGTSTLGMNRRPSRSKARRRTRSESTPATRRTTLVLTAWVVTAVGALLGLAPEEGGQVQGVGAALTCTMILGNLLIAQAAPATVIRPWFSAVVATTYSLLLLGLWQIGDQQAVQILVGSIAVLDLAVVGLSLGEIFAVALAMAGMYLVTL